MHEGAESSPVPAPRAGDVIGGRFVVEETLGAGAMGVVVAARSIALKRRVAIKLVKVGAQGHARFEREAVALASLESDHVVRVLEYGASDDGAPYLVMEFLVGRDLAQELRARGRLSIDEAVDCILEACVGLSEAHARGIVHRDIKPGNLFLAERAGEPPRVKILDFGISKVRDPEDPAVSLTDASATMGSPAYMSPEQVRLAKGVDHRADIWSLGVVLYRLVTGRQPFVGDGFSAICAAVATDAPPPLREARPDAPFALEMIVLRCLEKDPSRRYADVRELAAALASLASSRGQRAAARIAAAPAPPSARALRVAPPLPAADDVSDATAGPAVVVMQAKRAASARRVTAVFVGVALALALALAMFVTPKIWAPAPPANVASEPPSSATPPVPAQEPEAPAASAKVSAATQPAPTSVPARSSSPRKPSTTPSRRTGPSAPASATASTPAATSATVAPESFGGKALQSRE